MKKAKKKLVTPVIIENLNDLAVHITKREGKKISLSIAQIKEVLGIVCELVVMNKEIIPFMIQNGWTRIARNIEDESTRDCRRMIDSATGKKLIKKLRKKREKAAVKKHKKKVVKK